MAKLGVRASLTTRSGYGHKLLRLVEAVAYISHWSAPYAPIGISDVQLMTTKDVLIDEVAQLCGQTHER
jgi:hypothetical protein